MTRHLPTTSDDLRSDAGRRGVSGHPVARRRAPLRRPIVLAAALLVLAAGAGAIGPRVGASSALFTDTAAPAAVSFATPADWVAPTTTDAVLALDGGALPAGTLYRSTTYRAYAAVTDDGGAPSGVSTVTADVSGITAGAGAVALSAGSWTVGGITYGWRSGPLTAASSLAPGTVAWAVTATDAALNVRTQSFSVVVDTSGPTFSGTVIAPTGSVTPGYIRQGGAYQVYAIVSDPVAVVTSVTANVTSLTAGASAVSLTTSGGPWVVGGVSYSHRSAALTANAVLAAGAKSYTLAALDALANSATASGGVTVDNTAPVVSAVALLPEVGARVPGFIRQGTAYRVYANAADASAGLASLVANVAAVSAGQTAVALGNAGGPWTVNGVSYAWRSASLTSDASLTAGAKAWTVTATDVPGNGGSLAGSATGDTTAPTISAVTVARATGTNPSWLSRSAGYHLYANATDASAGVASIVANASTLSTGGTAVALATTGGPWTVNGVSYTWRSPLLTTDATLADGARTVAFNAWDNAGGSAASSASATVDGTPPVVTVAQVIRTTDVAPGAVKRSTSYRVYASVSDTNLSVVTANVSALTSSATALALTTTGGPWTVAGVTYTHRSASTTAAATIVDGTVAWTLTATDLATNATVVPRTVIVDNTAPAQTAATIAPAAGATVGGFIRPGASYHVYATITDPGSGIATVTASTNNVTSGATATPLTTTGGPWVVGGVTYTHRSAALAANASISGSAKTWRITAADNLGTSAQVNYSVAIDSTAPAGTTSVIAKASGLVGIISSGTTYYVYANASDASGIAAITANMGSLSTGVTAAALSTAGGPWTVGATSYAWRSAPIVANPSLTNGTAAYALGVRDNASNTAAPAFTVTVNNASPGADASARGIRVTLVATGSHGPVVFLTPGGRYRLLVRVDGTHRVRSVTVDASALSTGARAPHLQARAGTWLLGGRASWPWRTQRARVSGRAIGSLPVVVRLTLAGGRILVTTLAVPVRARPGAGSGTTTEPVPAPTSTPDPGTGPEPTSTPDPTPGSTPAPTPTADPEATPAPTPDPPGSPMATPDPTPGPAATPGPTPDASPDPTEADAGAAVDAPADAGG